MVETTQPRSSRARRPRSRAPAGAFVVPAVACRVIIRWFPALLTVELAAHHLGVEQTFIIRLRNAGELTAVGRAKRLRFRRSEVDAWAQALPERGRPDPAANLREVLYLEHAPILMTRQLATIYISGSLREVDDLRAKGHIAAVGSYKEPHFRRADLDEWIADLPVRV